MMMTMMMMMMSVVVNDAEAIVRVRGRACVCVRECAGAFMSGLLFACLLRALECMLTHVIRLGRTAVHSAVNRNQSASVEALVKTKADVNIRDECACLAACCCCKVDLKLFRRFKESLLEEARYKNQQDCIAVLEAAGAT